MHWEISASLRTVSTEKHNRMDQQLRLRGSLPLASVTAAVVLGVLLLGGYALGESAARPTPRPRRQRPTTW